MFDDLHSLGVSLVFKAGQQLAEYARIEVDDGIGGPARALVPKQDLFVRSAPELSPLTLLTARRN